jgi:predicted P-loop ATPase
MQLSGMRRNGEACSGLTNWMRDRRSQTSSLGHLPKGEWTDYEDHLAAEWLQRQGVLVSGEVAGQAVQTAARDHPFHPVKAYLQGLHWDGVERVDRWLSTYLGAEDTEYSRAVGSRWLISAVARIFRPGGRRPIAA